MLGINKLLAFLRRQVGLRTDAASATGSLHGKVKHLNDTTVPAVTTSVNANVNTRTAPRGVAGVPGSFTTTQTTYQTALNITGTRGKLIALSIHSTGSPVTVQLQLTVDGFVIGTNMTSEGATPNDQIFYPTQLLLGQNPAFQSLANGGRPQVDLHFKSSLKLAIRSTDGQTVIVRWLYETE